MIKIPGTDEGLPGDRADDLRGPEHQRHAAVRRRGSTRRSPRPSSTASSAATRRARPLDMHSVASFFVSRVDTEVDKRLEAARPRRSCRARPGSPTPAPPTMRFKEIFHGERFAEAARRPARRVQRPLWASTGVKNPAYPDTLYVDGLVGAAHGQHDADGDAARRAPTTARSAARPPTSDPERRPAGARRRRHRPRRRHRQAAARRRRQVRRRRWRSCSTGIETKRAGIVTTSRPSADPRVAARRRSSRRSPRASKAARRTTSRGASGTRTTTLWAPDGQPEVADRLGWLTIADAMRRGRRRPRGVRRRGPRRGLHRRRAAGHGRLVAGARGLPPSLRRRSRLARACTCSTRPTPARSAPSRTAVDLEHDAVPRVDEVRRHDRDAVAVQALLGAAAARAARSSRSPTRAPAWPTWPRSTASGARSSTTPTSAGATARCRTSGSCPAALMGADVAALLDRRRASPSEACAAFDTRQRTPGSGSASRSGELALAGRDKLTFVVDAPIASLRPLGRAADRRVDGQGGQGHRAGRRRAARRRRRPTATTASSCTCATPTSPTRPTTTAIEALASAGHPVIVPRHPRRRRPRRGSSSSPSSRSPSAGWVLGINPFDQPNVQEAKDATKQVLDIAAPSDQDDAGDDALRALLGRSARRTTSRSWATSRRRPSVDAAVSELRAAIRDAHALGDDVRLRPALPALDRPAAQGRPADRAFPAALHDAERRRRDPRRRLRLHAPQARAGDRRPRDAALPRAAGRAGHARPATTRPPRCASSPSA